MNDSVLKLYKYLNFENEKLAIILAIIISIIIIIVTIYLVGKELKND